jgi:hypothetical protein
MGTRATAQINQNVVRLPTNYSSLKDKSGQPGENNRKQKPL